ncbi:hypothetical protein [Bernardetia sp. MNP-M8]|uniref:hypothetical protein n=1 Tax=Bernardetia sp. MNP-M8 TaxID=3127470 RepID=UPI0030D421F7
MKTEKSKNIKLPPITIDKKLERFKDKNLFPEKLAKTQEIIAKYGLPKTKNQT